MGFYSRFVFPRVCDLLLNSKRVAEQRRRLLASVEGSVLEIGLGSGLNLPHYPGHIRKITGIDRNAGMARLAGWRANRVSIELDQRCLPCEQLPFEDASFDCVVSTFTLCSIRDVNQALGEVHRVLQPGGRFLYLEHGLSPEPHVRRWQRRLNRLEMLLGDGCHLDRNIHEMVVAQAFSSVEKSEEYLARTPKTHGYLYRGIATK